MQPILTNKTVNIDELKHNPTAVLAAAQFEPVAVLEHNKQAGYIINPKVWKILSQKLEDAELIVIDNARLNDNKNLIEVSLDQL
jgi:antitoxin StbD